MAPTNAAAAPALPSRRVARRGGGLPGGGVKPPSALPVIDPYAVLNALPDPVIVIDGQDRVRYANLDAQEFFDLSLNMLEGVAFANLIPPGSPVFELIGQVRRGLRSAAQDGLVIDTPRTGLHNVTVQVATMGGDPPDHLVVTLHERTLARRIDASLTHRNAARSVTAMAAMLAHEVKNPLSGIRGAAQLLEENAHEQDRVLTRLICDEADRIVALVNRMEVFSDRPPCDRGPVNIHGVLEHVRRVAQTGFARNIRFVERYDPSLPAVHGNRDQLIQVFLNLVKNAAEAVSEGNGEIILSTAYQQGVRIAMPGGEARRLLPLVVSVQDNGDGIAEDLRGNLFDPFVTTKVKGTGLGLALVAKIIGDHGGVIDFDSQPRRTVFKVSLPMYDASFAENPTAAAAVYSHSARSVGEGKR